MSAEVWDWALKVGSEVHRLDRVRKINESIHAAESTCGSCSRWMTRDCPRERNVNGWNKGPAASALACGQFAMTPRAAIHLESLRSELALERHSGGNHK